jgi:16S rRNA (adenine1518-N6/adenine1519-N6)-dimethyltransferase
MSKSIPALLREYGLQPRKRLGQNFLIDAAALQRIIVASDLGPDDIVIEVGSGLGTLTRRLAERTDSVLAIELDERLVAILREELADLENVQILHGDVLKMNKTELGLTSQGYKVVANLPYYITSAVLRHFLEAEPRPSLMVVTVQREVAERIVAEPGKMSLLAVSVQFYGRPQIVTRIPAGAFHPRPSIDSAVIRIDVGPQPQVVLPPGVNETTFFRVVRAGFQQRRKTLRNALSAGLGSDPALVASALKRAGVDPRRRAETLSLEDWAVVTTALFG